MQHEIWTSPATTKLWDELRTVWAPRSSRVMGLHTAVSTSAFAAFSLLEQLIDRWTGRRELAQDLVTGLSGVYTAEIGPALWEMACQLRELGLADVVLDDPPADALAKLEAMPEARPVMERLDGFLQRHGHRCPDEAELLNSRWAEAPEQVVDMMAGRWISPWRLLALETGRARYFKASPLAAVGCVVPLALCARPTTCISCSGATSLSREPRTPVGHRSFRFSAERDCGARQNVIGLGHVEEPVRQGRALTPCQGRRNGHAAVDH